MILDGFAAEIATIADIGLNFDENGSTGEIFVEHLPQAPDIAIAVVSGGGPEASSKDPWDQPEVHFQIRGDQDPRTAVALWYKLYSHFHALRNHTLPDGTYLTYSLAVQSSPARIGPDDNGRHQYSLNLRCEVKNSTEQRP
jgi:hypothetical protein